MYVYIYVYRNCNFIAVCTDGSIIAEVPVSSDRVAKGNCTVEEDSARMTDVSTRLRLHTVPPGYTCTSLPNWTTSIESTFGIHKVFHLMPTYVFQRCTLKLEWDFVNVHLRRSQTVCRRCRATL